jgi:hypothetical protein
VISGGAISRPHRRPAAGLQGSPHAVLAAQGVLLGPQKQMICDDTASWMMRHLIGQATPELAYLRADAAIRLPKRKPQVFGVKRA